MLGVSSCFLCLQKVQLNLPHAPHISQASRTLLSLCPALTLRHTAIVTYFNTLCALLHHILRKEAIDDVVIRRNTPLLNFVM